MRQITLTLPDFPFGDTGLTDDQIAEEIRKLAAVKLYEMGRISSGRAAILAGLSRVEFLDCLGRYGVSPFQIAPNELKKEVDDIRAHLG